MRMIYWTGQSSMSPMMAVTNAALLARERLRAAMDCFDPLWRDRQPDSHSRIMSRAPGQISEHPDPNDYQHACRAVDPVNKANFMEPSNRRFHDGVTADAIARKMRFQAANQVQQERLKCSWTEFSHSK